MAQRSLMRDPQQSHMRTSTENTFQTPETALWEMTGPVPEGNSSGQGKSPILGLCESCMGKGSSAEQRTVGQKSRNDTRVQAKLIAGTGPAMISSTPLWRFVPVIPEVSR
jgi:hypothetical protein